MVKVALRSGEGGDAGLICRAERSGRHDLEKNAGVGVGRDVGTSQFAADFLQNLGERLGTGIGKFDRVKNMNSHELNMN